MEKFDLLVKDSVLIYGAGVFGREIYARIRDVYDVKCFVERNIKKIVEINLPVKDLNHITEFLNCVVIICVHNANWHGEIAEKLYRKGFNKILFLAMNEDYSDKKALDMNKFYNLFLEEQYECLSGIPCYSAIKGKKNVDVIREIGEYVVAWCGKDLLYSIDKTDEHHKDKMSEESKLYLDVPIIATTTYVSLIRFFMFGEGNADLYIKHMKALNNSFVVSEEEFFQEQYEIYSLLEKEYAKGNEWLQYMPIDVRWNERGYFNIIDGHHRCAFYLLKGLQKMPIRMKRVDYDKWLNITQMGMIRTLIDEGKFVPSVRISHPVLRGYTSKYTEYETTILDILQEWLYLYNYKYNSVLEISNYQAYYGIHFYKMNKAENITVVVEDKCERELVRELCRVQYVPDDAIELSGSFNDVWGRHEQFEIALIMGEYGSKKLKSNYRYLKKNISKRIFWQSGCDIEKEKSYIMKNVGFSKYELLATKCFNGRLCEIGVFSKNED